MPKCCNTYAWCNELECTSIYIFGPFVNYNHKKFQYIRHRAGSNVSFVKFGVIGGDGAMLETLEMSPSPSPPPSPSPSPSPLPSYVPLTAL